MAGFQGADTEALRTMAQLVARRSDLMEDLCASLRVVVEDVEWVGEDADHFRAEWAGIVRPGLEDCSLDLRRQARRLIEHADEQDAASVRDHLSAFDAFRAGAAAGAGLAAGIGAALAGALAGGVTGGISAALQALHEALLGDGSTPEQRALAALLGTPMGRLGLLAGLVSGMLGGPIGDMIGQMLAGAMLTEKLLDLLGTGVEIGDMLGMEPVDAMMGRDGVGAGALAGIGIGTGAAGGAAAGGAAGEALGETGGGTGGGSGSGSGGGEAGGGDAGGAGGDSGSGGDAGGSGGGSGSGGGGAAGGGAEAGADAGAETAAGAAEAGAAGGVQASSMLSSLQGPEVSSGAMFAGRIGDAVGASDESGSLWDQLLALLGSIAETGVMPGVQAGMAIGSAHLND